MTILITGGSGFIGTNFIEYFFSRNNEKIVNLDKLGYASVVRDYPNKPYVFIKGNILDTQLLNNVFQSHQPKAVINFAAESHVDRSIKNPAIFMESNICGVFNLLEVSLDYWRKLSKTSKNEFRFMQISTDEVYGSLENNRELFTEKSPYKPNSPYAASKAAADHLVRAYGQTYGLPVLTSNCSNNYGPFQFPEKLIPLIILNALAGKKLPLYGDGKQIRNWLYVFDHCHAIELILKNSCPGERYNIGGYEEKSNFEVIMNICTILDTIKPRADGQSYLKQIAYIEDRPGHDRRYAINFSKINQSLGWTPTITFKEGLKKTINWYLANKLSREFTVKK